MKTERMLVVAINELGRAVNSNDYARVYHLLNYITMLRKDRIHELECDNAKLKLNIRYGMRTNDSSCRKAS